MPIMRMFLSLVAMLFSMVLAEAAEIRALKLQPSDKWLTVASSRDFDEAVGIAKQYREAGSKVVSSTSGNYAVIMGPYRAKSLKSLLVKEPAIGRVPADALLSNGKNYVEVMWDSSDKDTVILQEQLLTEHLVDRPLKLQSGNLSVDVLMPRVGQAPGPTLVTGSIAGAQVFQFVLGSNEEFSEMGARAGFVTLDPTSPYPQLMVTRYSGGAHCCTKTWFISNTKGSWIVVEGNTLDGSGYGFVDLERDGRLELLKVDNRFLYAFDSYAASVAPLLYERLEGGSFIDISNDPVTRIHRKRDAASVEFNTRLEPELWKSNGYLVGWLASKIRLGDGEQAWTTVMENYDRSSDFGPQECVSGQAIESCPVDNLKTVEFPKALAQFLQDTGYGPLPQGALGYAK